MSQTWLRGPICGVDNCRSHLYRLSAGRKFCQFGHVAEGSVEFDDDEGVSSQTRRLAVQLTDTGFGARVSMPVAGATPAQTEKRLYGSAGRLHYLRCVQHLLRRLACQTVPVLHPELSREKRTHYEYILLKAVKLVWTHCAAAALRSTLPADVDLYVYIYLAERLVDRRPVYVDDFLLALRRNALPFVELYKLLPKEMAQHMSMAGIMLLSRSPVPVDDLFYRGVARWTRALPRELHKVPAEHFYGGALRVFADLALGEAPLLLVMFHRLIALVHGTHLLLTLHSSRVWRLPECQYVGFLHAAVRLFFVGSARHADVREWGAWLDTQRSSLACFNDKYHHMDIEDLLALLDEQTEKYCHWVAATLGEEGEGTMERKLLRLFSAEGLTVLNGNSARERSAETGSSSQAQGMESNNNVAHHPRFTVKDGRMLEADALLAEKHLATYLCFRFGLKTRTFGEIVRWTQRKIERAFENRLLHTVP